MPPVPNRKRVAWVDVGVWLSLATTVEALGIEPRSAVVPVEPSHRIHRPRTQARVSARAALGRPQWLSLHLPSP